MDQFQLLTEKKLDNLKHKGPDVHHNSQYNLSIEQRSALKQLSQLEEIVIWKAN